MGGSAGGDAVANSDRNLAAAAAANDGTSLSSALAQSIRHHSRMIDGEKPGSSGNTETNSKGQVVRYDYETSFDEDVGVTLALEVEEGIEKEARSAARRGSQNLDPTLQEHVANARTAGGIGPVYNRAGRNPLAKGGKDGDKFTITDWFQTRTGRDSGCEAGGIDGGKRSVRFAKEEEEIVIAAAIANGELSPEEALRNHKSQPQPFSFLPRTASRAPTFVAPPPTTFRTATSHPSQETEFYGGMVSTRYRGMKGCPPPSSSRAAMAAYRKRRQRLDTLVRLAVAVLCLAASLTFAFIYGEGRFGLIVSTAMFERKVARTEAEESKQHIIPAEIVTDEFYPSWWESENGVPNMEARNVALSPAFLEYLPADKSEPLASGRVETPFLWIVPRSGGNVIRAITSKCLRLAEASDIGAGSDQDFLLIQERDKDKTRYVNVDMFTPEGIERAHRLNLIASSVPDIVITNYLHDVLNIFDGKYRARLFVVLRHPLERATSKYYSDLASDSSMEGMTLAQYARSGGNRVENNYLTRSLTGRYNGTLHTEDLDVAREMLRRKFVVGLVEDIPLSVKMFSQAFRWNDTVVEAGISALAGNCFSTVFMSLSDQVPPSVEKGSEGWKLLVAQNWFDLKLYEYAEYLFQFQKELMGLTAASRR